MTAAARPAAPPAVDVLPAHISPTGPDKGLWFVYRVARGATLRSQAALVNPAHVAQRVQLSARELHIGPQDTTTVVADPTAGLAPWVHFDQAAVTVPARSRLMVGFTVTVPDSADPGDATGAVVATGTATTVGQYHLVTRVATRMYVTVPGAVVTSFRLSSPTHHVMDAMWPSRAATGIVVANTGTVRFEPTLTVDGTRMSGSQLVVSHSQEDYAGSIPVPWYGGRIHETIVAQANGRDRTVATRTFWVIPWGLLAISLVGLLGLAHLGRGLIRGAHNQRAVRRRLAVLEATQPGATAMGAG